MMYGHEHPKWIQQQWTREKWAEFTPEQKKNLLYAMRSVPWVQTAARTAKNRRVAQGMWRRFQCGEGCECCPDEETREANARAKLSQHMKGLQQLSHRLTIERGKQYLDQHHPGWREE